MDDFPRSGSGRVLLVLGSFLLYQASSPGNPLPVLAVVSLVPFALALHRASPGPAGACGLLFGLLIWLGSTPGLAVAATAYLQLSPAAAIAYISALAAFQALPYGLFGWLCAITPWREQPAGILFPAACLSVILSLFPTPLPVSPDYSLYVFPVLLQTLDLGGRALLLFLFTLVNWLTADLILRARMRRTMRATGVTLLALVAAISVYGLIRLETYRQLEAAGESDERLSIAAIQPNFPLPGDPDAAVKLTEHPLKVLLRLSDKTLTEQERMDLVIWPEIPSRLDCADGATSRAQIAEIAQNHATSLLINCVQGEPQVDEQNTSLFFDQEGKTFAYTKQMLFPFVERIPGEEQIPLLRRILPGASGYKPGNETVVFELNEAWRLFSPICYEVLFSPLVREFVEKGGNILVNQANDAWFGESRISDFLIAASTFRAIAYRVPVVRVSNSGNSLGLSAGGEPVPERPTHDPDRAIKHIEIFVPEARSPYFHLGDLCLIAQILYLAGFMGWRIVRGGIRP